MSNQQQDDNMAIKKVGETNGTVSWLFSLNQYLIPIAIVGVFGFIWNINDRVTRLDSDVQALVERKIPPDWFEARVDKMELKIDDLVNQTHSHIMKGH